MTGGRQQRHQEVEEEEEGQRSMPPGTATGRERVNRAGMALSVAVADSATVSLWAAGGGGGVGGGRRGIRVATTPNHAGVVVAAMLCETDNAAAAATAGDRHGGSSSNTSVPSPTRLCELSASLPVADGICLTPGVVLAGQGGQPLVGALAIHASWRF